MLSPTDAAYVATKKIRLGKAALKSPFKECVEALRAAFPGVSIFNAHYERIAPHDIPRLTVVVDYDEEQQKFFGGRGGYDKAKQAMAAEIFRDAVKAARNDLYDTRDLFVIFSDFEGVARIEANAKVKEIEIERLRRRLAADQIWAVHSFLHRVDFLFHTDAELNGPTDGLKNRLAEGYAALIAPHDEFGYLANRPIAAYFSSKETFDRDYNSSWFNYYR